MGVADSPCVYRLECWVKISVNGILFSFSIFPRKRAFTFHADCLLRRQYAWKCLILFSRKTNKSTINLLSVELAQRAMKVKNHLENSLSWNTSVRKHIVLYTWIDSLSKQCRPRSDAALTGVCSGSTLFAFTVHHEFIPMLFWPLKPHFYIVKLGYTGVYIIFLISAQIVSEAVLTSTHNLCFEQKYEKYQSFSSEFFVLFLEVKFSIYLNRRVSVMRVSSKVSEYSG